MYSEDKIWDWYDITGYTDFIRHIRSNAVKMQKFPLCIKESGGMFERGKDKAKFLEELSHGYGMSADAYHMTQPDPEARGVALCLQRALHDAGVGPHEVGYINAHGTSTPYNDKYETLAVKKVFGEHAYRLAISSTKSMTGHLLGGAGGIEGVFTALALHHGVLPPTINWETPDAECDLDYIPHVARATPVQVAMSTSLGFGGTNACVVFKKYPESP